MWVKIPLMVLIAAGLTFGASVVAVADSSNGKSHGNSQSNGQMAPVANVTLGAITDVERTLIFGYLRERQGNLPPVFAEAKPLPPGIARKIARGGAMPPGIAKRYFPDDLLGRLPPRPGQQWLVVGTDILLMDVATQIVVDILRQAL